MNRLRIQSLQVKEYRNIQSAQLDFSSDLQLFIGLNAQGKTNLLESIFLLALGKSHRTRSHRDLIQFGKPFAVVAATIQKPHTTDHVRIVLSEKGKRIEKNGVEQPRLSQYVGTLPAVLFSPEDLELVKGSPRVRRRFLDMEIGQVSPTYIYQLNQYQQLIQQRNRLLKDPVPSESILEVLDQQLVQFSIPIWKRRLLFLNSLKVWAKETYQMIADEKETLEVYYQPSTTQLSQHESAEWEDMLSQEIRQIRTKELRRRTTLIGPHRDDLRLEVAGVDVGAFGSQGQQRTAALALKLAELELIREEIGYYPILLLDDVLSELDDSRRSHLLKKIQGRVQTFVTATSLEGLDAQTVSRAAIYQVAQGKITKQR
ncbi:DNA replication and repair protein RecF [Seinonella peptonophila]|uniref:DNA replication and repair protein RecF n=1 Tax=Seinonella peptonophila TaxID=112248 RepID=A0A1M4WZY8_9BACL|nr:DNA replication/repair protein RecF [Seinonella peptonophila]SHE86633.1 DNA replication and repair protein RecF [Seinonella peptonophila]